MPNQIPVLNYIFNIIEDTYFWINISKEHLVMINELLKGEEEKIEENVFEQLNHLYDSYEGTCAGLENLKDYMLTGEKQYQFYFYIGLNTQKLLQDISALQITSIEILSKLEEYPFNNMTLLIINHAMMEDRYALELLSSNINKIAGLGFR
ncbi:MAG: DUF2935 domain-containing protein [Eubacteriales bacterium]